MKFLEDIELIPFLIVAVAISAFVFFGVDIIAGKRLNDIVLVYNRQFIPAYTETYVELEQHIINEQSTFIPVVKTRHHPDEYILYVDDYEHRYKLHTNVETFFSVNPPKEVQTSYIRGKWTKLKYFEKVIY